MGKRVSKRLLSGVLSAMMVASAVPATMVAFAGDQCDQGTKDGYDYELWNQNYTGNVQMSVGNSGTFSCSWSGIENCLFRSGKRLGSTQSWSSYGGIQINYDVDYTPKGNSYMCIYGWTQSPLVEYYIVEAWGDWRPPGQNGGKASITVDGKAYDVYTSTRYNQPSIEGNKTFEQYWSVQKTNPAQVNVQKNLKGTITVSDHFAAWEKAGMQMGKMYEVALNIEGYRSSGSANVKKNELKMGGGVTPGTTTPTTTAKPKDPNSDGSYFKDDFSSGAGDWSGRGDASVKVDSSKGALYVSGRTDNWNGAAIALDSSAFQAGNTYAFAVDVLQTTESSTGMKLTLQYTDSTGTEQYDEVASGTASNGQWTQLYNGSYSIPSGASNMILYVEAPDSLTDFYVDNAMGAVKGTKADTPSKTTIAGQTTVTTSKGGNVTTSTKPGTVDTSSFKGAFAPWFKIGTSVSPREFGSGSDFIKKNYSSITPENELKPDSILDQGACQQRGNNVNTQITLNNAAQTLKFCEQNGISLRGHTFVWYSQTPDWFFRENFSSNGNYVSKQIMDQRLESMIKNTFAALKSQYPNLDVYAYDVCNELFVNDGGGMRPANNSNWVRVYGDDSFVINAFKYARQYAPANCKLYLNDYNEYISAKTDDIYNMAKKIMQAGDYIDGIGMQSHLATNYPDINTYTKAMDKFLSLGLELQITELDITDEGNTSAQYKLYEDVFKAAMERSDKIPAVTIWGTSDNYSWRSSKNPLLFKQGYVAKESYNNLIKLAQNTPVPAGNTTTASTTTTTKTTTTTTSTKPSVSVSKYGDANCDGNVNMGDVVLVMQSLCNPSIYGLNGSDASHITEKGQANADVYDAGDGITNSDALSIQKYLIQLITSLPESVKKTADVTTTATTKAPVSTTVQSNKTYISESFENGVGKFEGRGSASIAVDKSSYYSGNQCLYVSGRTQEWNGAQMSLGSDFVPGNSYSFSTAVMQATGESQSVKMTLQYTDSTGTEQYDQVATATAKDKTWTDLSTTSYTIPSGATNLVLYVELPDSTADYYMDDITVATEGTASKITNGGGKANPVVTTTTTGSPISSDTTSTQVDPSKPMIAISFDDGAVGSSPSASSMRIINALADNGFRATFFYVGDWIKGSDGEQEVKYAYSKGMEIANHTTTHPYLTNLGSSQIRSEVDNCAAKLKSIIGVEPSHLLRLPYLASNGTVQSTLSDYGLITCAVDTEDWNNASKDQIVNKVKSAMSNGSGNGAIVLCHETYNTTAGAIEELAPYCKSQGWQIVTISEMFAAKGKKINGGQIYTKVG